MFEIDKFEEIMADVAEISASSLTLAVNRTKDLNHPPLAALILLHKLIAKNLEHSSAEFDKTLLGNKDFKLYFKNAQKEAAKVNIHADTPSELLIILIDQWAGQYGWKSIEI